MPNESPNVLLIICDQMTARLTGAYGHPVVKTPNLNKLAESGIRFDSAYSPCPVCVPARASLITGNYGSRIGCHDNSGMIPADQPTMCHYMSIAGYETVASGKLHFIGPDQLHGFERRLTTDFHPSDFAFLPPRPKEGWDLEGDAGFHKQPIAINYVTAEPRQWSIEMNYDEETHFRALEFLRGKRTQYKGSPQKAYPQRDERPFFLTVSYSYPHEPFYPTSELWDLYENLPIDLPEIPDDFEVCEHAFDKMLNAFHGTHRVDIEDKEVLYNLRRAYYALVTYIDNKVGELIQTLEDNGLKEDTLIMFISDHGDMLGERKMVQKRSFYEYSAQVPFIVNYPARWDGGSTVSEAVSLVDVMPTILDAVGISDESILPIDGNSVIPLIEGNRDPERTVFAECHSEGSLQPTFMARRGDYKYIHCCGYSPQLYNINEDPKEWNNLAGRETHKAIEEALKNSIFANFNPDEIESDVQDCLRKRNVLKAAMQHSNTSWDYQPNFDATKQYWRG